MTNASRIAAVPFILALTALALPGCLERKETIRVHRTGAVNLEIEISGDPADFASGDALPEEAGGWTVKDETQTDERGRQTQKRTARMSVPAGRPLPETFALEDSPSAATALRFPTEVRIEKRPDGTYYHFRRVYEPREGARYEYYTHLFQESGAFKQIQGKDPADLTDEEREQLLRQLRVLEALKRCEFVRTAATSLERPWPQHYELLLRRALLNHFEQADLGPVLELLRQPQSEERDAQVNRYGEELVEASRDTLRAQLEELRVPRREIEAFFEAYDEEQARRAVTEDLGDERFRVRVELPGELVAHNGDSVDGGAVVWEFGGKALMDREHVLMATSRVEGPAEKKW